MTAPEPIHEKMTVAQFEAYIALPENRDRRLELVDGEVVEKMTSQYHNRVSRSLFRSLDRFTIERNLGEVEFETSVRASEDDSANFRIPDLSFTKKDRVTEIVEEGPVLIIPDICIEIQSPDDYPEEMRRKASYYIRNGAREVWLIFTKRPRVEIIYPDGESDFFNTDDVLTSTVLPDFRMNVADIFNVEGNDPLPRLRRAE